LGIWIAAWHQDQENVNPNSTSGVRSQENNGIRRFNTKHNSF